MYLVPGVYLVPGEVYLVLGGVLRPGGVCLQGGQGDGQRGQGRVGGGVEGVPPHFFFF